VRAVEDLSFEVGEGETVAIVGESGSGKSTAALALLRLVAEPGRIAAGQALLQGRDIVRMGERDLLQLRGRDISMIFQDPMMALNPVHTVGDQIAESLTLHFGMTRRRALDRAVELLGLVRVPAPETRIRQYPHNLSGGMRQRVMIAIALACNPRLLIADEPTTALDVTIQAQVLELIRDLKRTLGMSVLLITHDLGVVAETASRVVVMYAGRKVEEAPVRELFAHPQHPYTEGLIEISRWEGTSRQPMPEIAGTVPSPHALPPGCSFAPRCGKAIDACRAVPPPVVEREGGRSARCHLLVPVAAPAREPR
jgi:oligopeptide/dipeptide ABC transporter ATP-binding protein